MSLFVELGNNYSYRAKLYLYHTRVPPIAFIIFTV
nr:MAG TPA_asm: hypothetical protein [Caudoviricetes sp.]